jgi:hypothetical protein
MSDHRALTVALFLLTSTIAAQRTWIVDSAGGAGVDFTDLPPAFAAVADGDRVIVRSGSYAPATLTRAIQLVGNAGATVSTRGGQRALVVSGIPAGKVCSIEGISVGTSVVLGVQLQIDNCAGAVVLQRVDVTSNGRGNTPTIQVGGSAAVMLHRCSLNGGLSVFDSTVSAADCSMTFGANFGVLAPPTIFANRSQLDLAACRVIGSGGLAGGSNGILAASSTLVVRKGCHIEGGWGPTVTVPSIQGQSSTRLTADPAATMTPAPQGLLSLVTLPLPTLRVTLAPLGGSLVATLAGSSGDLYALFAAAPTAPVTLPFGSVWLQASTTVFLGGGLLGSGTATVPLLVPNDPNIEGLALALQAVSGPTAAAVQVANPVGCVLIR